MKPPPLGLMRVRAEVQARTIAQDSFGAAVPTWTTLATRWARVEPLSGREQWQAQQVRPDVTHRVTLRYYSGLTPTHRLKAGDRVFNVESVLDLDTLKRVQECVCVEAVLPGGDVPANALLDGLSQALLDGLGSVLVGA